ncbi:rhomboid family intramembrane serine protease [Enemella evansiae]|uniref:Peptidase S54 rhomboid domain-containing protein n=1 Tax=Enemella evansiae TaxID=2016499 RepID=A0A255GFY7_9ACTN|nr:rhomboid family intramembrane serine protease [Enemella evansiae]OYO04030.1 hypothetical protein CGZ97_11645 [Enemella evansiae]OYO08340.1 hypothetical protein CGZ98_17530 [Enemella evansiae]OYO14757.1 hypothetical protein CGZ94_09380 [Enemella evansiae]
MTEGRDDRPDFTWEEFAASPGPGGGPPPSDDERFKPCFRHPDRSTGITCQRCDRAICGECMRPASVGFQCPVCVAEQQLADHPSGGGRGGRGRGRRGGSGGGGGSNWRGGSGGSGGRRPFSGPSLAGFRLGGGPVTVTAALMVLMASVGLIDLVTPGRLASQVLGYSSTGLAQGQLWRLVTGILVPSGGILSLLLNLLFLWLIGRDVEAALGRGRMVGIAIISGLGSAAALSLLYPTIPLWGLAYSVIIGLIAARAALGYRAGEDVRSYLILFAILLVFNLVVGSMAGAVSLLGAVIAGIASGALLGTASANRTRFDTIALITLGVVLAGVCLGRAVV